MLTFPGATVTINIYGPSAADVAANVVAQLTPTLTRLENTMTDASTFLTDLGPKIDTLTAGMADIAADVQVLLDKAASAGVFTADEQALADGVTAKFDALKSAVSGLNDEVGDQDGSDAPAPEPETPAEPTEG